MSISKLQGEVELNQAIESTGYHPALVADALGSALGHESCLAYVVHQETTFDSQEVRRHVTVLALTQTRFVVAHADEHDSVPTIRVTATTEAVPLHQIKSVVVSRTISDAATSTVDEVLLTIGWGGVSRLELDPAGCDDPNCEADHGYAGAVSSDDLQIRVAAAAEGREAVVRLLTFVDALSAATSR